MTQSSLNQNLDSAEGEAYLAEKLPITRFLLPWFIALLVFFLIAWTWLSEIDIVSTTRGIIIPNTRLQVIQSRGTNVVNQILVNEGDKVQKGDILVEFLQDDTLGDQAKIQEALFKNLAESYRLEAIVAYYRNETLLPTPMGDNPFLAREMSILKHQKSVHILEKSLLKEKIASQKADRKSLEYEIELLDHLIPKTENELKRSKSLLKEGIIGQEKLDELKEKLIRQKKEKQIKQSNMVRIDAEMEYQMESSRNVIQNRLQEFEIQLLKVEQENRVLIHDLNKMDSEVRLKNLISPITGFVNKVMVHTNGAVVQSGESIMSIIPEKSPLEVEAKIMNQDVGFIEVGQTVAVKLDSFNFTKYGKLSGVIRRIASGAVEDPQLGMVYPTIIELISQKIEVGEKIFRLRPGMTVTIDIKTGKRRIADYILEPFLRYGDEALRER